MLRPGVPRGSPEKSYLPLCFTIVGRAGEAGKGSSRSGGSCCLGGGSGSTRIKKPEET